MKHDRKLPFRFDSEAIALGYYCVLDFNYKLVREFETIMEAEAFIAEANGSDIEAVRIGSIMQAHMMDEYRENLRRSKSTQNELENSTATHGGGWSWDSLPNEIKHRFSPPPERSNFSSTEEYEEASGFWSGRVGRNIALALQQHKQSKPPE